MSKSGSFTLALTVICLSVLMSLEADAQSTTDETNSCSSSSLEEVANLVRYIVSVQQENAREIRNIALNQLQNANDIKNIVAVQQDMKEQLAANSSALEKIANEVERIAGNQQEIANLLNAVDPSKQALVSALVSEFHSTHIQQAA